MSTGANARLGLPTGKMRWVVVAFDVDGTLITSDENEPAQRLERQIELVKILAHMKNVKVVVWSGGGKDYAAQWGRSIGLDDYVWKYASKTEWGEIRPDIAIDDIQDTAIGQINLIVREK